MPDVFARTRTENPTIQRNSGQSPDLFVRKERNIMAENNQGCGCFLIILILLGFIAGVYLYSKGFFNDPGQIPHPQRLMLKLFAIRSIEIYQKYLSPALIFFFGRLCRYSPSCSEFCILAIKKHGVLKGIYIGLWRILKCNPFNKKCGDDYP